jgi:hypothetical protein
VVADVLAGGEEVALAALVGSGRQLVGRQARADLATATRQAAARMTSPSGPVREASSSSTLRPGRTTRAEQRSGASGTGPRISTVMRAVRSPSRGSQRSSARASRADGGPACCAFWSHGPRVSSDGTSRSPSAS